MGLKQFKQIKHKLFAACTYFFNCVCVLGGVDTLGISVALLQNQIDIAIEMLYNRINQWNVIFAYN